MCGSSSSATRATFTPEGCAHRAPRLGAIIATEVATLRIVGMKELRDHATKLLRGPDPVLIMRRDKVAGVFLPLDGDSFALEIRREVQLGLAAKVRESLRAKGISERDILNDFEVSRKARRRR